MAAELLDIEAKLDTSQVQGQLSQLSKTSGLQNLDRAIRTLEQSMKKLSSALDKQAQQAASGGGSGGNFGLSRGVMRGLGGMFAGKTLRSAGELIRESGDKSLGTAVERTGKFANKVGAGAAVGMIFGPEGAMIGAAIGALQAGFESLTDSVHELNAAMATLAKQYADNNKQADSIQESYLERKWKEQIQNTSGEDLQKQRAGAEKELEVAERKSAQAQEALSQFRNTEVFKSILNSASTPDKDKLKQSLEGRDEKFVEKAMELNDLYGKLIKDAQEWEENVRNAKSHMSTIEKREKELQAAKDKELKAAEQAAKEQQRIAEQAAKEQQRIAQQRERIKDGFASDLRSSEFQQKLDSLVGAAQFSGMSQDDIKQQASQAAFSYNVSQDELNKLRKEAIASGTPEEYEKRIREKETEVSEKQQLANAWQSMIAEPMKMSLSELMGMGSLGPTSSLASMGLGLGGELIEDKLLNNTDKMLNLLRIVADNSKKWNQTETSNLATYQS